MSQRYCFIVNPISGGVSKLKIITQIERTLAAHSVNFEIWYTSIEERGTQLAKQAIQKGFDVVVAVGGDGTVHEVGIALVDSGIPLGIIPVGSGNGLARSLKVPMSVQKALNLLFKHSVIHMDVIRLNDYTFLNMAGLGFDAYVAHQFSKTKKRGLISYVKEVLAAYFSYQEQVYTMEINGKSIQHKALLLSMANSSQFGNNAHIAPMANVMDGVFELCLLKKFPWYASFGLVVKLFLGNIYTSKYYRFYTCTTCSISHSGTYLHLDGEPLEAPPKINLKMHSKALKVISNLKPE